MKPTSPPPPGSKENPVLVRNDCPGLHFANQSIQELFLNLYAIPGFDGPQGELSVVFLPDDVHTQLHLQFHDNPEPTDVITFQGDPKTGFAGEICASPSFARKYCWTNGTEFSFELTLYLIHGWLHLCGLSDVEPGDRQNMRGAEQRCLKHLRKSAKIPSFLFSS